MKTPLRTLSALCLLLAPATAFGQTMGEDRTAFGDDGLVVTEGEIVRDATAFGGDLVVDGAVTGDATSFGGDVILRGGGWVGGDITSFGGAVRDQRAGGDDAVDEGALSGATSLLEEITRSAAAHVMLFLLGLLMIATSRERLRAMQTTMIKDGLHTTGVGFAGFVLAAIAIVVLCITIIGIPGAVVLAVALPLATYVGLAAAATIIGAALPLPQLEGKEIHQLGAGVGVLFIASLVPVVGTIVIVIAACLGVGALLRTRFSTSPPDNLPTDGPPMPATA